MDKQTSYLIAFSSAIARVLIGAPSLRRIAVQERCDGEKICGGMN
jgi:hypothetical protein